MGKKEREKCICILTRKIVNTYYIGKDEEHEILTENYGSIMSGQQHIFPSQIHKSSQ